MHVMIAINISGASLMQFMHAGGRTIFLFSMNAYHTDIDSEVYMYIGSANLCYRSAYSMD